MLLKKQIARFCSFLALASILFVSGCTTQRMAPPLFSTAPRVDPLERPHLLQVPEAPVPVAVPLLVNIPRQDISVGSDNSIMRHGSIINPGSSVVISVPASVYQHSEKTSEIDVSDQLGFRTDGYFNVLEQYIERGLIASGFHVKDRAKFEAKLRDLRGGVDSSSSKHREELVDISEVIRAAQDGDVMADYVLQVNELTVMHYSGTPLQLGTLLEVQAVLQDNPGLRLGTTEERGVIPSSINQPWAQARFNAKLIDVKTGSIDWIGEFTIESLTVLEGGININIGIRKRPTNAKVIVLSITDYNTKLNTSYRKAAEAKNSLNAQYKNAMLSKTYYGVPADSEALQDSRRRDIKYAEKAYSQALSGYRTVALRKPRELSMEWQFAYDVDAPVVIPDLLRPSSEDEKRQLLQHVKDLGSKVTRDLLATIKVSEAKSVEAEAIDSPQ